MTAKYYLPFWLPTTHYRHWKNNYFASFLTTYKKIIMRKKMDKFIFLHFFAGNLLFACVALAEGGPYSNHGSITDGSAAAAAGTIIYNTINPKTPLPVHGSDDAVIKGTIQNMGAGNSLKDAWKKSVESAAGASGGSTAGATSAKP